MTAAATLHPKIGNAASKNNLNAVAAINSGNWKLRLLRTDFRFGLLARGNNAKSKGSEWQKTKLTLLVL